MAVSCELEAAQARRATGAEAAQARRREARRRAPRSGRRARPAAAGRPDRGSRQPRTSAARRRASAAAAGAARRAAAGSAGRPAAKGGWPPIASCSVAAEAPDVGGAADLPKRAGSHCSGAMYLSVPTGSRGTGARERPRDAQVDQPRRPAEDDVAGLDVEVDDVLRAQVVQDAGDVERERQQLLDRDDVAADHGGEPRPLDVLEHQVRAGAVEPRAEAAQQARVGEAVEQGRLGGQRGSARSSSTRSGRSSFATTVARSRSSQAR